jgi:hypothetical protein
VVELMIRLSFGVRRKSTLQLGGMEYWMYLARCWKLKFVSDITDALQYQIGPKILETEFVVAATLH